MERFKSCANELSSSRSQALGMLGERHAAYLLQRVGYHVETVPKEAHAGDLRVTCPQTGEVWRVEVKTSRRANNRREPGWQFCLRKPKHTDYAHADFVLLMAVRAAGTVVCFLIPTDAIETASQIRLACRNPLEYKGKYARYRMPYDGLQFGGENV